jgi:glycosyltransferase involved in cell wall biosynthesis
VIVPTLNAAENIGNLITSIYDQDYRPLEVIAIDGGSVDETIRIAESLEKKLNAPDFRIKLLRERDFGKNRSPANAKNIGVLASTSEYLLFFDSDFQLTDPNLVSEVRGALNKNSIVGVKVSPKIDTWLELHCAIDDFRTDLNSNVHSYCGYRREIFSSTMFDPALGFGEDSDFLARAQILPAYVDAHVQRHFVHRLPQWQRQALWYGRTFPRFLKKRWRSIDFRKPWLNPYGQLAYYTAGFFLLVLALAAAVIPASIAIFLTSLILFLSKTVYHYMRSRKGPWRYLYILLRETYYGFWFTVGILSSVTSARKIVK